MNDPREMNFSSENGAMLEQDNRHETMYKWGAMIVDLCDMPVSEYMKPMTVLGVGSGSSYPEAEETLYTLKFVIDSETVLTQKIKGGDTILFEVNGEKEDRIFKGWFYGSTQYKEGDKMPSRNLTLTAKYECEVSFMYSFDGEEILALSYIVPFNSKITNVPSTEKEGYNFKGWQPSINDAVTKHTTFVGTFEIKKYTVIWNGYADGPITQEYKHGDTLVEPSVPTKEGHTFSKWDIILPQTVTENLNVTAVFTINQYTIVFSQEWYGVRSELSAITQNYGTSIMLPNLPTENGYSYTEWYSDYSGKTVPAHNIEYVTIKTVNTYILAYYDNGELVKEDEYEYMETVIPYSYEKPGYVVSEWTNLPTQMPYNNVSAHCTSEIMKFTVTFMDQDGNIAEVVEGVPYGTEINTILPVAPEGYSYEFDEVIEGQVKSEMTISLFKVVNKYDVTINGEIVSLAYGTDIIAYVNDNYKAEEGYHIVITASHDTVPANNTATVEYVFEANVWVLTYSTEGADENINGSKEVAFGTNILSVLPLTEKEGYDFNGWFDGEKQLSTDDTMPNNDLTVMGTYDIELFEVTIFDGDIKILNKPYVYKTKLSSVLNDETIMEYVSTQSANGQTVSFVLNGEPVNEEMEIVSKLDIYVEKMPNEYLLVFKNGGETISENLVKFGEVINYPTMENKTEDSVEYVFVWEDESYNGKTMPAQSLTIVGNYQEKAEAPIYYGFFVTSSKTPDSKIFNEEDFAKFEKISVAECLEDNAEAAILVLADEYLLSDEGQELSEEDWDAYMYSHLYPHSFLIPSEIDDEYEVTITEKASGEKKDYTTDNVDIEINGVKYHLYTYLNWERMHAQDETETFTYNIKLTK